MNDDMVAALADGSLADSDRVAALAHVASCVDCRAQLASVARLLADPAVAGAARRADNPVRPWLKVAVPVGIAAILLVVLVPRVLLRRPPLDEHRASVSVTAGESPQALHPVGQVAAARRLTWSPVAQADRYRATLFDAEGRPIFELVSTDTVVSLPDSVSIEPLRRYFWRVEARTAIDRWSSSGLVEFEVTGGRAP
ncbi:MAG TPA: zf-HC2 domain-containing protein [Gemmatimonadales bacterium]|nr:zf-HC2 domain-containing protein [Gemmatimonadales bacterium]